MSQTSEHPNSGAPDALDRRLSDFFQSQLPRSWPAAPVVGTTEPSELVAVRNHPAVARGDSGSRARLTLAVSVAFLLGTCWYLSNGWQPAARTGPQSSQPGGPGIDLNKGSATLPAEFQKDKAPKKDGFQPSPIKMP